MEGTQYHFVGIHAATPTTDGQHIILQAKDGDGNVLGISLPTEAIPVAVAMLMSANAGAMALGGKKSALSMEVGKITITDPLGPEKQFRDLRMYVHQNALPVSFRVNRQQLLQLAHGVIEAESGPQTPPDRPN